MTTPSQCLRTKDNIWMSNGTRDDLFATVRDNGRHLSRTGGAELFRCRWRADDGTEDIDHGFDPEDSETNLYKELGGLCYFYDTDHPEGMVSDGPPRDGHRHRQPGETWKSTSPYASPFVSFTDNGTRFAVFPASLLAGYTDTVIKTVPVNTPVRKYAGTRQDPSWRGTDDYKGKDLQLKLCRVGALFAPAQCTWVSVNADASTPGGSFESWIAAARG